MCLFVFVWGSGVPEDLCLVLNRVLCVFEANVCAKGFVWLTVGRCVCVFGLVVHKNICVRCAVGVCVCVCTQGVCHCVCCHKDKNTRLCPTLHNFWSVAFIKGSKTMSST